jgi:hypothetical protein
MTPLTPEFTGRKRHRTAMIKKFWRKGRQVLVLQYEVSGYVPELVGGFVDGSTQKWWIDAKPEWEMNIEPTKSSQATEKWAAGDPREESPSTKSTKPVRSITKPRFAESYIPGDM